MQKLNANAGTSCLLKSSKQFAVESTSEMVFDATQTNFWKNTMAKPGLYANIHAKQERIKAGSGEKMRSPGAKGAPTSQAFKESAKTAKKKK